MMFSSVMLSMLSSRRSPGPRPRPTRVMPRPGPPIVSTAESNCSQDSEQLDPNDVLTLSSDWGAAGTGIKTRSKCAECGWSGYDTGLFEPTRRRRFYLPRLFKSSYQPNCVSCDIRRRLHDKLEPLYGHKIQLRPEGVAEFREYTRFDLWKVFIDGEGHPVIPSGFPRGVVVSSDTGSAEAVAWVRSKLATCLQSHSTLCGALQSTSFVPTRLIYLEPLNRGGDVILLEGQDVPPGSAYVALSHCWGGKIPDCTTTRETLADRKNGIPWESIPNTFRDAMEFTLKLGLEYIWIDSVCIIQQDPSDWVREAGRMYHVYKNAQITVGAVYAENCSEGLFSGRNPRLQRKVLTVGFKDQRYQLYARRAFPDMHLPDGALDNIRMESLQTPPLFRRAWTFQERMVTPRSVFFVHGELMWDCYESVGCECGEHFDHTSRRGSSIEIISPKSSYKRSLIGDAELSVEDTWWDMVSMYSILALTNPHDKLPGIGAIAEEISRSKQPKDRYLAGLWSDTLASDLLWRSDHPEVTNRSSWTAPTWSWASIKSPIKYGASPRKMAFQTKVTVQDATCDYKDGNPYGVVVSGQVSLRGYLVPCILRRVKASTYHRLFSRFYALPSGSSDYFCVSADEEPFEAFTDEEGNLAGAIIPPWDDENWDMSCIPKTPSANLMFDVSYERHYELLQIATATHTYGTAMYCLMVSKSPKNDGTYVRKGVLHLRDLREPWVERLRQVFESAGKLSTCRLV
ncbi:HET-domain-containing protein [Coniochaeta ligniaria NRRL 30616]|uniref:HET-domain-containing protein n=1 Tax=Coniochaeta ligniaria NRRL 30616 TaxID=1408157 RepID=A0A1J7ICW2_9PEZI|nr:HET-domain-containing protein [Coniochaeta ligniaria NRRL 30616]